MVFTDRDTAQQYFMSQGFNTFRVPFLMERVSPPSTGGLTGPFNSTYLSGLQQIVSYITGKGGFAVVDRKHEPLRFMWKMVGVYTEVLSPQLHDLQWPDHFEHQHVSSMH